MSTVENNSSNDVSLFDIYTSRFFFIQFWIFLLLIIPSLICSLFGLYHFLRDRTLGQALNNHIIIVLLLMNLFYECTDTCWFIHYFRTFQSLSLTPTVRLIWGYIDWTFYVVQLILYAWVTIERHILIFHDHLLVTQKNRVFIHYIPPIIRIMYCLLYYVFVFFGSSCENQFDGFVLPSFIPCAYLNNTWNMYEIVAHEIVPVLIIVISGVVLFFRVIWQRYHAHRQIHWRRYRKMTIQVLSISSIYLIFPFPYMMIVLLHLLGMSSDMGAEFLSGWMYCTYYALLFFPIVAVGSLPKLKAKLKKILKFRRQPRRVGPISINTKRMIGNPVVVQ